MRAARKWISFVLGAAVAGTVGLRSAAAADGDDDMEALRKQAQKILELMKANEEALLKLSTGNEAKTTRPDVPVPPGEAAPGAKGADGKEAVKGIEKLIEQQRGAARGIPREIEKFIELIPP